MECTICFERFDPTTRIPVMLFCGHTFCLLCLARLESPNIVANGAIHDQNSSAEPGSIRCPECKTLHVGVRVHDLPKNYILLGAGVEALLGSKKRKDAECPLHPNRKLKASCSICHIACCTLCLEHHAGHTITFFSEYGTNALAGAYPS